MTKPLCLLIAAVLGSAAAARTVRAESTEDQKAAERKALEANYGERMKAAKATGAPLKACRSNAKVSTYLKKVMK